MSIDLFLSDDVDKLNNYLISCNNVNEIFHEADNSQTPDILKSKPTILCTAAALCAYNCFQYLLDHDADINIPDNTGRSLVHFACYGGSTDIIDLLSDLDVDFNKLDSKNQNCIHYSCFTKNLVLIERLFLMGIDIEQESSDGVTPIQIAAAYSSPDVLNFIIENSSVDFSTIKIAVENNRSDNLLFLLNTGKIDIPDDNSVPALLHTAARNGFTEVARILIDVAKVNINHPDSRGWSALLHASEQGHLETCKMLVEKGADVNLASYFGFTPTHAAMNRRQDAVRDFLLSKGGKCNPFSISFQNDYEPMKPIANYYQNGKL